ncbi:MAG: DUF1573 domain-containing protein [Clostridium sp.]|nr:DUF1573 domain-containing protein [Clostridium sp.]
MSITKDIIFDNLQNSINDSLIRHKSLLDIMTKLEESEARINRAIAKSVTTCGCIELDAKKQELPKDNNNFNIENLGQCLKTHLKGELCENCREIIGNELGTHMFYLASLCNTLGINLYDVLLKEYDDLNTLGKYNLR